jgi:geranylgeranyl reductase family protein
METVMARQFDVIVVGGGPAGGTTAYELAQRGMQVLLLEKERLPRYKVCAGGLTLKTVQLLDFDISGVFEDQIASGVCSYEGKHSVRIDFGEAVGWTVMRDKLDHLILREAARAGTQVVDGQKVTAVEFREDRVVVTAGPCDYTCSMLVGADGANSSVARLANLHRPRGCAMALEAEVHASGPALESRRSCVHFDFGCVPRGYGWAFPKREILSVGVGVFRGKATQLKASLLGWLDILGLSSNSNRVKMRGHLVPLGGEARILHGQRVLLTGDAAGLAEPMTGEGIYYAVRSAQIAADTIHKALLDRSKDLSSYTETVNAEIAHDLRYAKRLAGLLYRFPRLCYHLFVSNPTAQRSVAETLCGRSAFEALYRESLTSVPKLLLSALRHWRSSAADA